MEPEQPVTQPPGETGVSTRERLLEAAGRLFAERGEAGVSIRDIAAAAGVRHGGVNYHFRSKSELYLEVLARFGPAGAQVRTGTAPALTLALAATTPEEARVGLRSIIARLVTRMTERPHSIAIGLMQQELKRPGGPREEIFRNVIEAEHGALMHVLSLLAPQLEPRDLRFAALGIMAQCVFLRLAQPIAQRLLRADEYDSALAEHVAQMIFDTTLHGLLREGGR